MIVYVFYGQSFHKVYLPSRIVGVYPVYYFGNRVLLNIDGSTGTWHINPADNFSLFVDGVEVVEEPELLTGKIYTFVNGTLSIFLVCAPMYYPDPKIYSIYKNAFSFGSSSKNALVFNNKNLREVEYVVNMDDKNEWYIEPGSNNIYLNDELLNNKTKLYSGDYIFCFGVKLIFIDGFFMINTCNSITINEKVFMPVGINPPVGNPPSYEVTDDLLLYDKKDYFIKSPRLKSDSDKKKIVIVSLPPAEKVEETPVILTLGPQLTMMAMSIFSVIDVVVGFIEGTVDSMKFITSMITVAAMLAGIIVWPFVTKIYNKRNRNRILKKRNAKYKQYLDDQKKEIEAAKNIQKDLLNERYPSLTECQEIIANRKNSLWSKNIDDDDFLEVSLGIGKTEADIEVEVPQEVFSIEGDEALNVTARKIGASAKYIQDVPLPYSLTDNYITAVIGDKRLCDRIIDNIMLQILTYHSYADLKILVYASDENEKKWEYLKIVPHSWNNQHNVRYFAGDPEEFKEIALELDNVFDGRRDDDEESKIDDDGSDSSAEKPKFRDYRPYYLILTDSIDSIRNIPLIKKILNYKKNLGFSIIIENDTLSNLPDKTNGFISVNEKGAYMFTNTLKVDENYEFKVDYETVYNPYYCGQLLANIPIMVEKGKYELPKSLSFLEMYNIGRIEQLNSLERWSTNNPTSSLSVPIGIDQNGEIFKMDIHEKVYGPHGLVAGTTGSGKSEWIVTFILSLAVNFNPDEVQFVLIDYKGGGLAMSFENKELGIKLPHLAGTITNLDKSSINRAISSIESELKRRQSIFNDAREKLKEGQMDIYKYQQFYRKGMVDIPLSHLLIICDEFAELKQQQPEFMDQLISTSRIGRSLGVHLILATQKPTGVVNDQIWSNSRFKVCLRVQDKSDSNEILKKPDAANLKQAGAFYLEVGSDEYYNLGQSAWAGSKYYPSDVVNRSVDQSVQYINNIGKVLNFVDDDDLIEAKKEASQGEELLNIVKYIDTITKQENFKLQQLWLPNIPELLYLADVKKKYNITPKKLDFTTVIGEYDEPRRQEQGVISINIEDGNIAIVGQPGSGKEMLLSTIIFSSITEHTPNELNYYILDFGAETLRKFSKFPHVGEVVFQDDMERVGGVIQLVMDELDRRRELFQEYNGSLKYYNENSGQVLPLICLVINGFDVFEEILARLAENLTSLFRDAPRYGIVFILSASSQNTFKPRVLQYFNRFVLLNLQDESLYRNLSNCRKGLVPANMFGRGICKLTNDEDSYCEFQTARITDFDKEIMYLNKVAETLQKGYEVRAKKITTIPDNVTSADLVKYTTALVDIPLGYDFYAKDIITLDLSKTKVYPIIASDLSKGIPFIYGLSNILSKLPDTVVRVIDVSHIFDKPILDIKLFKDDMNSVFIALEKDVKERTDSQPLAINIIVGAASVKPQLTSEGQTAAMNFFNGMISSKKNIFILVDEYKKFKQLKLEPWYSSIDTSNGLWLGEGIEKQSILITNELKEEDKKYKFDGMAYLIKDGTYTLIKTMMDGDD